MDRGFQAQTHPAPPEPERSERARRTGVRVWIAPEIIDAVDVINTTTPRRPLPEAAATALHT